MAGDFRLLLEHMPAWLMVLFRLSGIFLLAPMLGSPTVLRPVKVLLVLGLSLCVYPMLLEPGQPSAAFVSEAIEGPLLLWTLGVAIGLELLIGLAIGYLATLPLLGMQIGGQLIDQQVFPGASGVFNPELQSQSSVVGEFFFITALAIFVAVGGHRIMLLTLVESFNHVPLGGFDAFGSLVDIVIGLLTAAFEMGIRIAAPLLCLIFLQTLAMGFVARTVPGVNILSVGFAIRSIVGGALLVMGVGAAVAVYEGGLRTMMRQIMSYFGAG